MREKVKEEENEEEKKNKNKNTRREERGNIASVSLSSSGMASVVS